jgi:putative oxidoreductase
MDQFNKMLARYEPMVLSIFRIMVGLLLYQYGVAKILQYPVLPYFANIPPLIVFAGWLELVLGALLILGLFTRPVAFILSGEMAFAYFMGHMFKAGFGAPVFIPVLLRLPLSCMRRRRGVEPRCDDAEALNQSPTFKFVMPGLVPGIHVLRR